MNVELNGFNNEREALRLHYFACWIALMPDAVAGFGSSTKHFIGRRMLADALSGYYESVKRNMIVEIF